MAKTRNLHSIFLWALTLGDLGIVVASFLLGYQARFESGLLGSFARDNARFGFYWRASPLVALVFWTVFKAMGLYRQRRGISSVDEFSRLLSGSLLSLLLLSAAAFFFRGFAYSIKVFLLTAAFSLAGLLVWRLLFRRLQVGLRRRGVGVLRTVVVGSGETARKVIGRIKAYPGLGYRVVGVVDGAARGRGRRLVEGVPVLGGVADLTAVARARRADTVLVALPASRHDLSRRILLEFEEPGVEMRIVSDLFGIITSPMVTDEIHGIPVFALKRAPLDRRLNRVLKRAFDLALVVPGLVVLSPLMLALALLVKLTSPGPALYSQERVSRGNRVFKIHKFRTMGTDAEAKSGPVWTVKGDSRVTPLGKVLRKSSLDELPQLFNVLKGEMSLVGPRPERPFFVEKFQKDIARYLHRHQVKAGITGWAQVNELRGDTSVEERTRYDLYYVENWSFPLDVVILARTVLEIFGHKTAY